MITVLLITTKAEMVPVAYTSYMRVANYILIITPDGDTIRKPIYCAPGVICDSIVQVVEPDPGEWWTKYIIGRMDTVPPQFPPLEGCKRKFGKPTTFIFDTMTVGNMHYINVTGSITNYLDSAQYYGSRGLKFYVRTDGKIIVRVGVWLHDKNDFYVTTPADESIDRYKKGLNLVSFNFREDLAPGDWVPPPLGPIPEDVVRNMMKPKNKLLVVIHAWPFSPGERPLKVEVSELCLY